MTRYEALKRADETYIRVVFEAHGGKVRDAARTAGIGRTFFYWLLKRYNIKPLRTPNRGNAAWRALQ